MQVTVRWQSPSTVVADLFNQCLEFGPQRPRLCVRICDAKLRLEGGHARIELSERFRYLVLRARVSSSLVEESL